MTRLYPHVDVGANMKMSKFLKGEKTLNALLQLTTDIPV